MSGKPHPKSRPQVRRGEMRVCAAEGCANEFYAPPRYIRLGTGRFCSKACWYRSMPKASPERIERQRQAILALNRSGKRNPNYKHGRRVGLQIRGFTIAAKGETSCRACGSTDQMLHLHHAVPRSICPPEARRDLRNGIALCNRCHLSWHRGGLVLPRSVFSADEWEYISGLTLTGRKIDAWLDKHYPEDGLVRLLGGAR